MSLVQKRSDLYDSLNSVWASYDSSSVHGVRREPKTSLNGKVGFLGVGILDSLAIRFGIRSHAETGARKY